MADLTKLSERDLLIEIATEQKQMHSDIAAIKDHAAVTNGHIASLNLEHARQQGQLAMMSTLMRWTLLGIGAGASLAGVILAIVTRGM